MRKIPKTVSAQDFERGVFNHLGANVSAGTEGVSVGVATTITPYLELSAGVNFFPSVKVDGDKADVAAGHIMQT